MKKKLLARVLLGVSLVTMGAVSAARAETLPAQDTILETVDGVTALTTSNSFPILRVEGIVRGEDQAREFDLRFGSTTDPAIDRCAKLMLLSQTHPGRYDVTISTFSASPGSSVRSCKLKSR